MYEFLKQYLISNPKKNIKKKLFLHSDQSKKERCSLFVQGAQKADSDQSNENVFFYALVLP